MPGLVYIDTNSSTVMLTHENYFNCPDQYKKLRIRTGTANVSDTIGYPLTSDTTASGYSPLAILYTNNKVCYIATYSTGSSSASGKYTYTITSGYEQYTTGRTARTERRTGQGEITWEEQSTSQYSHHTEGTPGESYYSSSGSRTIKVSNYAQGGEQRNYYAKGYNVVTWVRNSQTPFPYKNTTVNGAWVSREGKWTKAQYISDKNSVKGNTGYSTTLHGSGSYDGRDIDGDDYNSAVWDYYITTREDRYTTSESTTGGYFTKPAQVQTIYSISTVTYKRTSYTEGVYITTTGWDYGYSSRYTERTSTSSNDAGQSWTHSNINIV